MQAKSEKDEKDSKKDGKDSKEDKKLWETGSADAIQKKLTSVLGDCKGKGESRNRYMNLAWTKPNENTSLQQSLSYAKLANMAMDLFFGTSAAAASAASASVAPVPVASADAADDAEVVGSAKESLAETLKRLANLPWNVSAVVERGFEIRIGITGADAILELGGFKRLAMDVVVNAV